MIFRSGMSHWDERSEKTMWTLEVSPLQGPSHLTPLPGVFELTYGWAHTSCTGQSEKCSDQGWALFCCGMVLWGWMTWCPASSPLSCPTAGLGSASPHSMVWVISKRNQQIQISDWKDMGNSISPVSASNNSISSFFRKYSVFSRATGTQKLFLKFLVHYSFWFSVADEGCWSHQIQASIWILICFLIFL